MVLERKLFKNGNICNEASVKLRKIKEFDIEKLEQELSISKEKLYNHKNWAVDDNNDYYYYKTLQNYNDFIGEELAKTLNLPTAHYIVGKLNNEYVVASKNFNVEKIKYLDAFDLISDEFHKNNLEKLKYLENMYGKTLVLDILKMTSLDIFSRQIDRVPSNYAFEKKDGILSLAPLYDYSFAFFNEENYKYFNYILSLDFNSKNIIEEIDSIINKYSEFYEYISVMNEIDLSNLINKIIEKNNFNYNEYLSLEYKKENESSHKLLKKIL